MRLAANRIYPLGPMRLNSNRLSVVYRNLGASRIRGARAYAFAQRPISLSHLFLTS